MTVVRCTNCRFWGDENVVDYDERRLDGSEPPEVRKCGCPDIRFKYNDHGPSDSDDDFDRLDYPAEGGAVLWDGSAYTATFATTGSFGCTLGEERP